MKHLLTRIISLFWLANLFTQPVFADTGEPLKVGIILPLSGALSVFGIAIRNGIEQALEEIPDARKSLQISYEDGRY